MRWDAFASLIGLPTLIESVNEGRSVWDGRVLRFAPLPEAQEFALIDVWHELGHALVAPKRYWFAPNRTWGQGISYDGARTPGEPSGGYASHLVGLESDASAVGIYLQAVIGEDVEGARRHAIHHQWTTLLGSAHCGALHRWDVIPPDPNAGRNEQDPFDDVSTYLAYDATPWPIELARRRLSALGLPVFATARSRTPER